MLPDWRMLAAAEKLIKCGVKHLELSREYRLIGHRQIVQGFINPGEKIFEEIKKWPQWFYTPENIIRRETPYGRWL